MVTKKFTGTLILNWKTGSMRVTKKPIKGGSPFEIQIRTEITVHTPEEQIHLAKGEVTILPQQFKEMVIQAI